MSNTSLQPRHNQSWVSQWIAVVAVLVISLLATGLAWQYEKSRVNEAGQAQFDRASQILQEDIMATMKAYAQFLRGGVGFVHASGEVSRTAWRQFVQDAEMEDNYPGIQGVSVNGFLNGEAEMTDVISRLRANDWPGFAVKPEGARDTYAPVLFLEPLSERNERAIGFDIYSEPLRRAAVDASVATGEPALTAKITLVQENADGSADDIQAGVLLILATYEVGPEPKSASERREKATGLIVSVFRMGNLINSVYAARGEAVSNHVVLTLYDAEGPDEAAKMFQSRQEPGHSPAFVRSKTLDVFGRSWTFEMHSSSAFEAAAYSASPQIVLGTGILVSLLLTSLVWGQSLRAVETEQAALKLTANQQHIEMLMGEVNHRSKNLLGLVQAIARQTKTDDHGQFVSQFTERVRALAASQDLLVKNGWKSISLNELIDSQLAHFDGLLGNRIQLNGPDLEIIAEASQSLGMAFHEMATNAGKYGALSNPIGTVDIQWEIVDEPGGGRRFDVSWLESGGPLVTAPQKKGFGSKVTNMMVKYALDGDVDIAFEPTGFSWKLSCPAHRVLGDPGASDIVSSHDFGRTA